MIHGAYIVARFSTENQNEDTIETQVTKCTEYCNQHGLPVLDVFADLAVSGMKKTRPELDRMMVQLRAGGADTVVVYDQSRLYRDMQYWFQLRSELDRLGVSVVSVTQAYVGGDLRDPQNFLMETTTAVFNQMWVLQTRQKVLADKKLKASKGMHLGGKPALGYRRGEDGHYEIDPFEAETVRDIFEAYASGQSYSEIIASLNASGKKTKLGRPFGKNSLHDLLKNEKYIGTVVSQKGFVAPDGRRNSHASRAEGATVVENGCPAIIDRYTWDEVQKRMAENKTAHVGKKVSREAQPLKGKVFCGDCGSAMTLTYSARKGHRYGYYKCSQKKRENSACPSTPIKKEPLEAAVAAIVRQEFGSNDYPARLRAFLIQQRTEVRAQAAPGMVACETELKVVKEKLDKAVDALLDGFASKAVKDRITALEAKQDELQRRLAVLHAAITTVDITDETIDYYIDSLGGVGSASDTDILALVARVEVYEDTIKVWTVLDGPPGTNQDLVTPKSVKELTDSAESAYIRGCPLRRTIKSTHFCGNRVIVTMILMRPRSRR